MWLAVQWWIKKIKINLSIRIFDSMWECTCKFSKKNKNHTEFSVNDCKMPDMKIVCFAYSEKNNIQKCIREMFFKNWNSVL